MIHELECSSLFIAPSHFSLTLFAYGVTTTMTFYICMTTFIILNNVLQVTTATKKYFQHDVMGFEHCDTIVISEYFSSGTPGKGEN